MKFAVVVLLACVAASSAAFTGSLVQHTQPAVDQTMFKLRLMSTTKTAALPQIGQIIASIKDTIQAIMTHASQTLVNVQDMVDRIRPLVDQAVLDIKENPLNIVTIVRTLIQNIKQELGIPTSRAGMVQTVQEAMAFIGNLPAFIDQLHASITTAISQMDFRAILEAAIRKVLPTQVAEMVISMMSQMQNSRGMFGDLFGSLFGGMWDQVTGAVGNVAQQIALAAQAMLNAGSAAWSNIQTQASNFVSQVTSGAAVMSAQAAALLMQKINEFKEILGAQWQATVDALQSICLSGTHTENPNCEVGGGDEARAFF